MSNFLYRIHKAAVAESIRLTGESVGVDLSKYTDDELYQLTKQDIVQMAQINLDKNTPE